VGGAGWVPPGQVRDHPPGLSWDAYAESLEQGKGLGPEWLNATQDERLALAAIIRNFVPSPTEAQIRSNKIPVLALIGEEDRGKKDVDRLDGLMPNLKIVVIPNASHGTAPTDPLFTRSFNDFLLENSSSKSGK
jgi:pimeloyl-ACP methyl ester carboxylesterase